MTIRFVVQRDDLRNVQWAQSPTPDVHDGEARLRVDAFALTSNNITYAAFGDAQMKWNQGPSVKNQTNADYTNRLRDYYTQAGFGSADKFAQLQALPVSPDLMNVRQ